MKLYTRLQPGPRYASCGGRLKESVEAIVGSELALVIVLAWAWWALGFHIVHKRPDWQYFGCEHTYVNDKGEDTGECR